MADANTGTTGGTQPIATEDAEADGEEGGGAAGVSVRPSTSYGELLYRSTSDLSVARLGTANTLSSTGMVRAPSRPWHTPSPQTLLIRWRVFVVAGRAAPGRVGRTVAAAGAARQHTHRRRAAAQAPRLHAPAPPNLRGLWCLPARATGGSEEEGRRERRRHACEGGGAPSDGAAAAHAPDGRLVLNCPRCAATRGNAQGSVISSHLLPPTSSPSSFASSFPAPRPAAPTAAPRCRSPWLTPTPSGRPPPQRPRPPRQPAGMAGS